jgi:uncharacterized membrane protein YbhN (UPF0104 family)
VLVRVAVGGALLGLLVARSGPGELRRTFQTVRPEPLVIAFGLIVFGVAVSAVRWGGFLDALGTNRTYGHLTRLYWIGLFFNSLLPTGIGGDVFKAIRVRRRGEPMGPAFASVLLDRIAGLVGLALLGCAAAVVRLASGDRSRAVVAALVLSVGVIVACALLPVVPKVLRFVPWVGRLGSVRHAVEALDIGLRTPRAAVRGLVWGVVYQASVVAFHVELVDGLHVHLPLGALVCAVVVVTFASLLPITINGVGVREGIFAWTLGSYGVATGDAVAIGLLVLGLLLAAGTAGGLVYLVFGADAPTVETADS